MSDFAHPASQHIHNLDAPLTFGERLKIVVQLGSAMLAGGLLLVGFLQKYYGPPGMADVGSLIIAVASIIVSVPIFVLAVCGIFARSRDAHAMTEQLVALATLAAMVTKQFELATLIPIIMNLGHFLEERSILGAQAAIEGLRTLQARKATLMLDAGQQREVMPEELKVGDILLVRPGDVMPADGEVIHGSSAVDQSSITGESVPEDVKPGKNVFAGTINLTGVLNIRVTKTGDKTALGRVVELLREAEQSKTQVMKLIEQYASYYVPIILTVAGVVLFYSRDINRSVAVLVVGCPGALILAGPTAMIAALAAASRLGILIKNTRFLEAMSDIDTVVLDKTGTVTIGHLELTRAVPVCPENADPQAQESAVEKLFREGMRCAVGSRHPASRAVVRAAEKRGLKILAQPMGLEELPGKGVLLAESSEKTFLGRREWLEEEGFSIHELGTARVNIPGTEPVIGDESDSVTDNGTDSVSSAAMEIGTTVWCAREIKELDGSVTREVLGYFALADRPRPEAREALTQLRDLGVDRIILLTGDRRAVAEEIGHMLEVDKVIAEVLPSQKLDVVSVEKESQRTVMMVGDGVNDAPALASGDVGIALGAVASDIAIQSADVALMTNDLRRIPQTILLARKTRFTIHTNILLGAGMSFFFVWLATIGYVSPIWGAILHNFGEAFVIINSARLLQFGE